MLSTEMLEATEGFARVVRQSPAVVAYHAARAAFEADQQAQALMAELRLAQQAFVAAQQRGETILPEVIEALRTRQADVRGSEVIVAHLRTTNDIKAFLPRVAAEVTRSLGTDYAKLIAPSGCC